MVEFLRLTVLPPVLVVVETLALLGERAGGLRLPTLLDGRNCVCREDAPLETDDAVGAVSEAGRWTGFVGDLGLGLTKPVSLVEGFNGCGFLVAVLAVGRVTEEAVLDVVGSFFAAGLT